MYCDRYESRVTTTIIDCSTCTGAWCWAKKIIYAKG